MRRYRLPILLWQVLFLALPSGCLAPVGTQLTQQTENFTGEIDLQVGQVLPFELAGSNADIGDYTARGEVLFRAGDAPDTLLGEGVAVFTDADGDQLVAVVHWPLGAERSGQREGNAEFRWRDSVTFADGTLAESTGKFADAAARPPGLVVIAIIAILIGRLCPAVLCRDARN